MHKLWKDKESGNPLGPLMGKQNIQAKEVYYDILVLLGENWCWSLLGFKGLMSLWWNQTKCIKHLIVA